MADANGSQESAGRWRLQQPASLAFICGTLGLVLSVVNAFTLDSATAGLPPAFQRSCVLAGVLSVGLMLVGVLWSRADPAARARQALQGVQGLEIDPNLPEPMRHELAWGSTMLLTATPAASLILIWDGVTLMRRGVLGVNKFKLGPILERAQQRQQLISLVTLKLYPGASEFDYLPENTPAVLVQPLGKRGWLVLGGWAERCFSRSDEIWIQGWTAKLRTALESEPQLPGHHQQDPGPA
jgi:hypothetical protein